MTRHQFGYARVSTDEQHLDAQIAYLKQRGVAEENIYTDKVSGTTQPMARKGFKQLVDDMGKGDELILYKLDRLSRRYDDLKDIISQLSERHITFSAGDLPTMQTDNHSMNRMFYDVLLSFLSFVAQNEREKMLERQRDGIEKAKMRGVYRGMPRKYSADSKSTQGRLIYNSIVSELKDNGTIKGTAKKFGVGVGTVQRIKRELEEAQSHE